MTKKYRNTLGFIINWQKYSCVLWFFWIECIPQVKSKKNIITDDTYRKQNDDSIKCGFYCIAFLKYMLARKPLLDCISLFSPNYYKKNNKRIYKYFKDKYDKGKRKPWL